MFENGMKAVEWASAVVGWRRFMPDELKTAWLVFFAAMAGCAFILVAFSAYYRFLAPGKEVIRNVIVLERKIDRLTAKGYTESWRDESGALLAGPVDRAPASRLVIQTRKFVTAADEIDFHVMVPFEGTFWAVDTAVRFEQENGSRVDLRKLFRTEEYQRAFLSSQQLICIGLASRNARELGEQAEFRNQHLSNKRAGNLCRILAGALGASAPVIYWELPLGHSDSAAEERGGLTEKRQRTAVIVGVVSEPGKDYSAELARLLLSTTLSHVDLAAYSNSAQPRPRLFVPNWESVGPIEDDDSYLGAESGEREK